MAEILLGISIKGKRKRWGFHFYGDPKYIPEWQEDGLDVTIIENVIPAWWVDAGLSVRFWCFWQDVFHFRNPWRK